MPSWVSIEYGNEVLAGQPPLLPVWASTMAHGLRISKTHSILGTFQALTLDFKCSFTDINALDVLALNILGCENPLYTMQN